MLIILFRFLVTTDVTWPSFLKSNLPGEMTNRFNAIDARLHTATYKKGECIRIQDGTSYLIWATVFYDFCAEVAAFDGTQVFLIALPITCIFV